MTGSIHTRTENGTFKEAPAITETPRDTSHDLLERLADQEHARWSGWMNYLFSKCVLVNNDEGRDHCVIPTALVERWKQQAATPYFMLTEQEKESDRVEARKTIALLKRAGAVNG
ncbi:MAG TPA: hypothetical protein VNM48_03535 [Chloroflexota bacterium]|nr:hypothetical protein [Chloroflexota bacterium]